MKKLICIFSAIVSFSCFSSYTSLSWKLKTLNRTNSSEERSLLESKIRELIKETDFSVIQRFDTQYVLEDIFSKINRFDDVDNIYSLMFEKIVNSGVDLYSLEVSRDDKPILISAFSSCNEKVIDHASMSVLDFSKPVINDAAKPSENSFGLSSAWAKRDYFLFPAVYQSSRTCRTDKQVSFRNNLLKKMMFNDGKPLLKYGAFTELSKFLHGELLDYYISSVLVDSESLRDNPLPFFDTMIYEKNSFVKILRFVKKYNIDLRKYYTDNTDKLERFVRYSKDLIKVTSLLQYLVEGSSDYKLTSNVFSALLYRDRVKWVKGNKALFFKYKDLIDLFIENNPELLSKELRSSAIYVSDMSLKIYLISKFPGLFDYKLYTEQVLLSAVDLGLPFPAVKKVVDSGFDVNYVGDYRKTLLHYAVLSNDVSMVEYLINKKAKVNVFDYDGNSPISLAKSIKMIKFFTKHGHRISLQNRIDVYSFGHSSSIVGISDVEVESMATGFSLVHRISSSDDVGLLKHIGNENKKLLTFRDGLGKKPSHYAAAFGRLENLKFLSEFDNFKGKDNEGRNIIFYAVRSNSLDTLKYLVDKGISPFEKDKEGMSAYDLVSEMAQVNVEIKDYLKSLIASGDVIQDFAGAADLIFEVILSSDIESAREYLILNNGLINHKDIFGSTPLIIAVNNSDFNMVRLLITFGADRNIKDDFGMNAQDHASDLGLLEIAQYLDRY